MQNKRFIFTLKANNFAIRGRTHATDIDSCLSRERIFGNLPLGDLNQTPYQLRFSAKQNINHHKYPWPHLVGSSVLCR